MPSVEFYGQHPRFWASPGDYLQTSVLAEALLVCTHLHNGRYCPRNRKSSSSSESWPSPNLPWLLLSLTDGYPAMGCSMSAAKPSSPASTCWCRILENWPTALQLKKAGWKHAYFHQWRDFHFTAKRYFWMIYFNENLHLFFPVLVCLKAWMGKTKKWSRGGGHKCSSDMDK